MKWTGDKAVNGGYMSGYMVSSALILAVTLIAIARPCSAEAPCLRLGVKADIRIGAGQLTLADLLTPNACGRLRTMATRVPLGVAPLPGTVRVLQSSQVRHWLESLAAAAGLNGEIVDELPARILVRRAGAAKSCSEISRLALRSLSPENRTGLSPQRFDCAAAQSVPEAAPLELTKTFWNASLERWEFSLHCSRAEDCAPFLVWAAAPSAGQNYFSVSVATSPPSFLESPGMSAGMRGELIKPGQTATLRWDEAGIRIVLPVTCLDPGGIGQTIRVRFKNAARILRAEILSDGTLWATL